MSRGGKHTQKVTSAEQPKIRDSTSWTPRSLRLFSLGWMASFPSHWPRSFEPVSNIAASGSALPEDADGNEMLDKSLVVERRGRVRMAMELGREADETPPAMELDKRPVTVTRSSRSGDVEEGQLGSVGTATADGCTCPPWVK